MQTETKSPREAQLEAENSRLRAQVELGKASARSTESRKQVDNAKAKQDMASRDDAARELLQINADLIENSEFMHRVLEHSGDCIKVLDLEGRLRFMSAGGMRVMEIDDLEPFVGCHWPDFWTGEGNEAAENALAQAKQGGSGRFQGHCNTAKGTSKWWDVQVTAINGPEGKPEQILSISRDISDIKAAELKAQLLADELNHRVKNTLAMVQAIANQTLRDAGDGNSHEKFTARLFALSKTHDILVQTKWTSAGLHELIAGATAAFNDSGRIRADGPEIELSAKPALALSLAFHELCTNAVKYGALSEDRGSVDITWTLFDAEGGQSLRLEWREQGGPPVSAPTRKGFGSRLIERGIMAELGGEVQVEYAQTGLSCRINALLSSMQPAA